MNLASIYHRILGRKKLFQFYANITHTTSEECLKYHGRIYKDKEKVPREKLDCLFHLLEFSVWKLPDYKEKGRRMKEKAEREIERRELFQEALVALSDSREEEAKELFKESTDLDIFINEIESFYDDYESEISDGLSEDLKEIFVHAYQEKFAQRRYERLPELMRIEREKEGVKRIKELFSE